MSVTQCGPPYLGGQQLGKRAEPAPKPLAARIASTHFAWFRGWPPGRFLGCAPLVAASTSEDLALSLERGTHTTWHAAARSLIAREIGGGVRCGLARYTTRCAPDCHTLRWTARAVARRDARCGGLVLPVLPTGPGLDGGVAAAVRTDVGGTCGTCRTCASRGNTKLQLGTTSEMVPIAARKGRFQSLSPRRRSLARKQSSRQKHVSRSGPLFAAPSWTRPPRRLSGLTDGCQTRI